jgi:putative protease
LDTHYLNKQNLKNKIELVSPAGGWDQLKAALNGGADAVYLGYKKFGARAYAENFDLNQLKKAVLFAHKNNVKIYLTLNTLLKDSEFEEVLKFLNEYSGICRDGIIIQDFGLYKVIKDLYPFLRIHASTQLNVHNFYTAELLQGLNFSRVVLAREMTLEEIKSITDKKILEIEVFAHGSQCYSYSGSCYLSSFTGERSGNRGRCTQPCRMRYKLIYETKDNNKQIEKPIKLIICNDGYLLSKSDLCTLEILPDLIKAGIYALKLEGRMKSADYVGIVTKIYRKYIDLYYRDPDKYAVSDEDMYKITQIFSRELGSGYFKEKYPESIISLKKSGSIGNFLGRIFDMDFDKPYGKTGKVKSQVKAIYIKSKWNINNGDIIEIWTNRGNEQVKISNIVFLKKEQGKSIYKIILNKNISISNGDRIFKFFDKELDMEAKKLYQEDSTSTVFTDVKLTGKIINSHKIGEGEGKLKEENLINYLNKYTYPYSRDFKNKKAGSLERSRLGLSVIVYDKNVASNAIDCGANRIIYSNFSGILKAGKNGILDIGEVGKYCDSVGVDFIISIPSIMYDNDIENLKRNFGSYMDAGIRNFLISNLGFLKSVPGDYKGLYFNLYLGSTLNIFNTFTLSCFMDLLANSGNKIKGAGLSPELSLNEISDILINAKNFTHENFKFSIYGYGYCPIMSSRYKLSYLDNSYSSERGYYISDLKGYKFKICPNYNEGILIFNSRKICLIFDLDKIVESGINAIEVDTRFMTDKQVSEVIKSFKKAIDILTAQGVEKYREFAGRLTDEILFRNYTKGHLMRSVL